MAIIKHNKLIETSYKLSSREQFFVLYLISQISQQKNSLQEYKMHYSEIEKIINFDGKRRIANKSEVFSLMDKLNSEPIIYERGSIIGKSVWLQHMEHDTDSDIFTFSLSEKLREYLLQLKEHFTRYNISNIVYLNANAVRLYEVLKRYQFKGEFEITVDKLKFFLGIENRYPKFYEFKRWVLIPSQKEIKKYTDIRFEYVPAKKQRKKIISLKFFIYENNPKYSADTIRLLSKIDKGLDQRSLISESGHSASDTQLTGELSATQKQAFEYLAVKKVNKVFIVDQILANQKVNYLPLKGYEDIYVRMIWKFFADKTSIKGEKMAGAFVSWWKKGRLTEDGLHAHIIEKVIERKKAMAEAEIQNREKSTNRGLKHNKASGASDIRAVLQQVDKFDMEKFKLNHYKVYQKILKRVKQEYERAFELAGGHFEPAKYRKAIEDRVLHECEEWYLEDSLG